MLTTLARVNAELRQNQSEASTGYEDTDATFIVNQIDAVNSRIFELTGKYFAPCVDTVSYDAKSFREGGGVDGSTLWLSHPLIDVYQIVSGEIEIESSDYDLLPLGSFIKWKIRLKNGKSWGWKDTREEAIQVTAMWAYLKDQSQGWIDTLDTLQEAISETDVWLEVTDFNEVDSHFNTPRFSEGQLLKLDDELVVVRKLETSPNRLGVIRGAQGSTKTEHLQGVSIQTWYGEPSITRGATRWVTLMYQRRAKFTRAEVEGMNVTTFPKDMPEDFRETLVHYQKIGQVRKA